MKTRGTLGMQFTRKVSKQSFGAKDGTRFVASVALPPDEFRAVSDEAFAAGLSLREYVRVLLREARQARSVEEVPDGR